MCKSLPQGPKRQWLQMYDDLFNLFIGSSVPGFNHDTFLGQDSFISRSSFWSLHFRKHWWDRVFGVWGVFQTRAKRYIYIHLQHNIYAPEWQGAFTVLARDVTCSVSFESGNPCGSTKQRLVQPGINELDQDPDWNKPGVTGVSLKPIKSNQVIFSIFSIFSTYSEDVTSILFIPRGRQKHPVYVPRLPL